MYMLFYQVYSEPDNVCNYPLTINIDTFKLIVVK